ncbi:uncharacterized protein LOC143157349 [Aptenodytes patagonicus]|uniref:uncharacterized protein LOC143157349 n=1 Tax=Aptenodytes patagonicus TaxID=9234 RepID=UPI003F9FF469
MQSLWNLGLQSNKITSVFKSGSGNAGECLKKMSFVPVNKTSHGNSNTLQLETSSAAAVLLSFFTAASIWTLMNYIISCALDQFETLASSTFREQQEPDWSTEEDEQRSESSACPSFFFDRPLSKICSLSPTEAVRV